LLLAACQPGADSNHTLVKDGWCWWYWKYAHGDTMVEGLGRKRAKRRKACGTIHCPLHRGNGDDGRRNIMDSTLHGIVNGAMIVRVHAERMADAQPQQAKSFNKILCSCSIR
jgi:hypothetical protein